MADFKKLAHVADVDFATSFGLSAEKLIKMLGVVEPIPKPPTATLKQYKITGTAADNSTRTAGQEIKASNITREVVGTKEIHLKPYRRTSTLEDIQANGYASEVADKDAELLALIQADIKSDIVAALESGTGTAKGTNMVEAATAAWAELQNATEGYSAATPVYFANPVDFAKCIGESNIFTAFGVSYLENWAGLGNLISTSAVPAGKIYVTAANNLKVYYIDASNSDGFNFETDETGFIAVTHAAEAVNLAYETVAWTALTIFPEYPEFVVKATITAKATQ